MAIREHPEGAVKQQAWNAAVGDAAFGSFVLVCAGPSPSHHCLLQMQIPIRLSLSSNEVTSSQGPPPLYVSMNGIGKPLLGPKGKQETAASVQVMMPRMGYLPSLIEPALQHFQVQADAA